MTIYQYVNVSLLFFYTADLNSITFSFSIICKINLFFTLLFSVYFLKLSVTYHASQMSRSHITTTKSQHSLTSFQECTIYFYTVHSLFITIHGLISHRVNSLLPIVSPAISGDLVNISK